MSDIKDDGILVICLHHVKWEWKTYTEEQQQQQRKWSLLCRNIPTTYTLLMVNVDYFLLCMQLMYIKMYVVSSDWVRSKHSFTFALDLYYEIGMVNLAIINV